jgi:hypothetical protein
VNVGVERYFFKFGPAGLSINCLKYCWREKEVLGVRKNKKEERENMGKKE